MFVCIIVWCLSHLSILGCFSPETSGVSYISKICSWVFRHVFSFWCDVSVQECVSPAKTRQCIQDWYCLASSAAGNGSGQLKPWNGVSDLNQGWIDPFNRSIVTLHLKLDDFFFGGQKYAVEVKLQLTYGCIRFWSMSFHIKSQFPMPSGQC